MKCFADRGKKRGCSVLNVKECGSCVFFKTEKQLNKEKRETLRKINNSPMKIYIYSKYSTVGSVFKEYYGIKNKGEKV